MSEDIKITKDDLVLWLDRSPSNDDLDLCSYLSNTVENQYKYYQELTNLKAIEKEHQRMNGELREEVKELKKQLEIGKQQYKDLVEEKENLQENLSSITLQLENTEKGLINEYNDMLDKKNKLFVENCKLKEKLENNSKINVSDHKYASKKEDEVITYKHIIDELEEWLNDLGNWVVLEKLQELKGESIERQVIGNDK